MKEKICILLNLAGEQAIEIYNTFTYDEEECEKDIDIKEKCYIWMSCF